jgi:hypothetical protein
VSIAIESKSEFSEERAEGREEVYPCFHFVYT